MEFNKTILSAKSDEENWISDPVTVSLRFVGPFEGLSQNIERTNKNPEYPQTTDVIIINEGLLDDSVRSVKYKLTLKKVDSIWIIKDAAKTFKCWKGRGHEDFSAELCK